MPIRTTHPIIPWLNEPVAPAEPIVPEHDLERRILATSADPGPFSYRSEFGATVPDEIISLASQGLGVPVPPLQHQTIVSHWTLAWKHALPFWLLDITGPNIRKPSRDLKAQVDVAIAVPLVVAGPVHSTHMLRTHLPLSRGIRRYERLAWALGAPVAPTGAAWVRPEAVLRHIVPDLSLQAMSVLEQLVGYLASQCGEMRAAQLNDGAPEQRVYLFGFFGCPDLPLDAIRAQAVDNHLIFGAVRGANGGVFVVVKT